MGLPKPAGLDLERTSSGSVVQLSRPTHLLARRPDRACPSIALSSTRRRRLSMPKYGCVPVVVDRYLELGCTMPGGGEDLTVADPRSSERAALDRDHLMR